MKVKKMHGRILLILSLFFSVSYGLYAQEISLNGEFRSRAEYRDGYFKMIKKGVDGIGFVIQRSRLSVKFKNKYFSTKVTLQDARTFGEYNCTGGTSSDASSLSVLESYIDVFLSKTMDLSLGRQSLSYDDKRIIGDANWCNTGKSHDLALLKYADGKFQGHFGLAYNNDSIGKKNGSEMLYTLSSNNWYKNMEYIWLHADWSKNMKTSLLILNEGLQQNTDTTYNRTTIGGHCSMAEGSFNLSASAYFQMGKNYSGIKANGNLISFILDYTYAPAFKFTFGFDRYSGSNNDSSKTFSFLYGGAHLYNGYMDYWTPGLPQEGLLDFQGGISGQVKTKFNYVVTGHTFFTAADLKRTGSKGNRLGSEVDLKAGYKLFPCAKMEGGYCMYFVNDNTKLLKNVSGDTKFAQWGYVSLTVKLDTFYGKLSFLKK